MAMQIKRGSETLNPTTADSHILEDGQLFYSKFNNQTYIGDNGKPISELKPKISSWLEPGEGSGAIQASHKYLPPEYHSETYSNEALGSGSLAAAGYGNKAFGTRSIALQNSSKSLGNTAFTAGQLNKNWANCTLVFGNSNIAGIESYDEDGRPTAPVKVTAGDKEADSGNLSQHSVVFGASNKLISASKSIIAGADNIVQETPNSDGVYSWKTIGDAVFGRSNQVTNATDSLVAGGSNIIDGSKCIDTDTGLPVGAFYNVVGGKSNKVNSSYSTAFGLNNTIEHANSDYGHSFVVGANNYTSAGMTFLLGRGLYSTNGGQTIVGRYNHYYNNNSLFIVGNGSADNRSNAFEVKEDGSAIFSGDITSPTITTITSDVQSLNSGKADKATTLSGYGITNAYTKTEVDNKDSSTLDTANTYTDNSITNLTVDTSTTSDTSVTTVVSSVTQSNGKISVTKSPIDAYTKAEINPFMLGTELHAYEVVDGNMRYYQTDISQSSGKSFCLYVEYMKYGRKYQRVIAIKGIEQMMMNQDKVVIYDTYKIYDGAGNSIDDLKYFVMLMESSETGASTTITVDRPTAGHPTYKISVTTPSMEPSQNVKVYGMPYLKML